MKNYGEHIFYYNRADFLLLIGNRRLPMALKFVDKESLEKREENNEEKQCGKIM